MSLIQRILRIDCTWLHIKTWSLYFINYSDISFSLYYSQCSKRDNPYLMWRPPPQLHSVVEWTIVESVAELVAFTMCQLLPPTSSKREREKKKETAPLKIISNNLAGTWHSFWKSLIQQIFTPPPPKKKTHKKPTSFFWIKREIVN